MIFESDAFFKSIDNSTDSDFTPGSHGRSDTPLKNISLRHDSGSETMGLVKDGVLILNTDGTLKIKMGRERVHLMLDCYYLRMVLEVLPYFIIIQRTVKQPYQQI